MEARRPTLPLLGEPRSATVARAREVGGSTWFLGAAVFALTWGGGLATSGAPSIDSSLAAGLNMAAVNGLDFGTDIVFTYGPLGYLKSYLVYYEWPARLAGLYGIALHLALSVSLVWALRRNFGAVIAVAVALVIAMLARGDASLIAVRDDASVVILALIWCVAALGRDAPRGTRPLVVYGGGAFAALELLAKINTGLVVFALVALTLLALDDRRRNLAAAAFTFTATATALWFASGQGVDDVWPYLRGSAQIISGYSGGARLDWESRDYDYVVAPLMIIAAVALAWISTAGLERARRLTILAIVAIVGLTALKGGLVSHDNFHMATFYATMLGLYVALPLPPRLDLRAAALAVTVAGFFAAFSTSVPGYPLSDPIENLRNGGETIARLIDGGRLSDQIAANRERLAADYSLDRRSRELLAGRPVHVDPSEAAAAWTYDLDWRPLPVFQPYAAWTPQLDRLNADAVASPDGPEAILRQNLNALGRYPAWESPAAMLAMLCNFEAVRTTDRWQVLERVPDRCGEPRPLGSASGTYGSPIAIPEAPPGSVVFGRVQGVEDSGVEHLRRLLHRSLGRQAIFSGDPTVYTLIQATAQDGLILAAAPRVDYPEPFALAPGSPEVTFLLSREAEDTPITVDFYAMAVRR